MFKYCCNLYAETQKFTSTFSFQRSERRTMLLISLRYVFEKKVTFSPSCCYICIICAPFLVKVF